MDLTRLFQMIVTRVMMRLINRGVDAGLDRVTGKAKPAKPAMTAQAADQDKAARDLAKRARQAAKLTRRL